jgi:eukaryotic-like serine/threonine-protein kinase
LLKKRSEDSPPIDPRQERRSQENILDFGFGDDEEEEAEPEEPTKEAPNPKRLAAPKKSNKTTTVRTQKKVKKEGTTITKLDILDKSKKTKIRRVKKKSAKQQYNYNNIAIVIGFLLVLVAGVWSSKSIISTTDTTKITTIENDKEEIQERVPSSAPIATLKLQNYNRRKFRTFVNGEEKEPDVLNRLVVEPEKSLTVRIEIPGRESFVVNDLVLKDQEMMELEVDITGPAYYGYLTTSRPCFKGKIFFEMFRESRVEELPISRKPGIPFPTAIDGDGLSVERQHEIYIQKRGQSIKKVVQFTIGESRVVDLCKILSRR